MKPFAGLLQGLWVPTFPSDFSCIERSVSRQSRHHTSCTPLASTALVATPPEPSGQAITPHHYHRTPFKGSIRLLTDSTNVSQTAPCCVSHLWRQYQAMGISEDIAQVLLLASCPSKRKTYRSASGRWSWWCDKWKVNSFSASLADILLYLTEFFNDRVPSHSVNPAHSAICNTHSKEDGHSLGGGGGHPLVTQLMKGMFNSRPPKPKYSHTWDVTLVTKYLASLGSNRLLSLKQLSLKLPMLFCLERVSAIRKLDLVHCRVFPEGMEFVLSATHKWGSSDQLTKAFLARFPSNSRLCLVETSGSDLKATHAIRPVFPLFQGGSVVYLIRKASQTNYGTIHQEVATFATQGFSPLPRWICCLSHT